MKKILFVLITLSASLYLFSCKQNDSPELVAERFAEAYHNMNFTTAKSLSTEASIKQLDMLAQMAESMPDELRYDPRKVKITMGMGSVNGDKASYSYTPSDNPVPHKIHLVKENGEWKVAWNKKENLSADKRAMESNGAQKDTATILQDPEDQNKGKIDFQIGTPQ
ncbi:MAG TPA: hypothetical protein VLZ83_04615 [Edaphocola sp.]|nr:hypothetical protein [Edaphocola sp.]